MDKELKINKILIIVVIVVTSTGILMYFLADGIEKYYRDKGWKYPIDTSIKKELAINYGTPNFTEEEIKDKIDTRKYDQEFGLYTNRAVAYFNSIDITTIAKEAIAIRFANIYYFIDSKMNVKLAVNIEVYGKGWKPEFAPSKYIKYFPLIWQAENTALFNLEGEEIIFQGWMY